MNAKKTWLVAFLLLAMIIASCRPVEVMELPVPTKELDLVLGFTPNVSPMIDHSLTSPAPGLRGIKENETITLRANESDRYFFNRWEITPKGEETYTVREEEYVINMTKNYLVKVFFGCKNDEACNERYMCEKNLCVPSNRMQTPPFRLAHTELGSDEDKETLRQVIRKLKGIGYTGIKSPTRFDDIDPRDLDNQVLLALYEDTAILVAGTNSPQRHEVFAREVIEILKELGIEEDKIRRLRSNQVRTDTLYELFFS